MKHEPVEWLYDGVGPLLLPEVLETARGVPLTLAITHQALARRLGIATLLFNASTGGSKSTGITSGTSIQFFLDLNVKGVSETSWLQ